MCQSAAVSSDAKETWPVATLAVQVVVGVGEGCRANLRPGIPGEVLLVAEEEGYRALPLLLRER